MTKTDLTARMQACRVVPVLTIEDAETAVDIAGALIAGGVDVLEVTLRTEDGLKAIKNIKAAGLDCIVGAGTVTTMDDVVACAAAGADFLVTPATPRELFAPLATFDGPAMPGCATPSEALTLYQHGFQTVKFFPAEPAGGVAMLKSLAAPLPGIRFMPTGGINAETASKYLALPNVLAVGGSWLCTQVDIDVADWKGITARAKHASSIA